jgi:hypothetical protein
VYENLTKAFDILPSFHILPLRALSGALGTYESGGILASYILLSQKPDHKEMQVIHFDQDVPVCEFFHKVPNSKYFALP